MMTLADSVSGIGAKLNTVAVARGALDTYGRVVSMCGASLVAALWLPDTRHDGLIED